MKSIIIALVIFVFVTPLYARYNSYNVVLTDGRRINNCEVYKTQRGTISIVKNGKRIEVYERQIYKLTDLNRTNNKNKTNYGSNNNHQSLYSYEYGFSVINIKSFWYLSKSSQQKDSLYHPSLEFNIKEISGNVLKGIKLEFVYLEGYKQIFDKKTIYIEDLDPQYTSKAYFVEPSMGIIFNDYNKKTITKKKYTIEVYLKRPGQDILLGKLFFNTGVTR